MHPGPKNSTTLPTTALPSHLTAAAITCIHTHTSLQANEGLRAEIERMRGEPSPLVAARAAKEETLSDKEKFLKLLDNLQVGRWG